MYRIDGETAVDGKFVDYDGNKGTVLSAAWLNSLQEEICQVITWVGENLDKEKNAQLLEAINLIVYNHINDYKEELDKKITQLPFPVGSEDKKFKNFDDFINKMSQMYIEYENINTNKDRKGV